MKMRPTRETFTETLKSVYESLDTTNHTVDIQGWMDPSFADVVRDILPADTKAPVIIEVGSWKGLSTTTMAGVCRDLGKDTTTIFAVDTWLGAPEFWTWGLNQPDRGQALKRQHGYPTVYNTFLKNVKSLGYDSIILPFPMSSIQAVDVFRHYDIQADLIYLDAAHEYESVLADLRAYWPLLKNGGTMIGDDYMKNWPGVIRAVDEFASENNLRVQTRGVIWSLKK